MPTYLLFFESEITSPSDIWRYYSQMKSLVENKISCSYYLENKNNDLFKNISESLNIFFLDCKIIEFGKMRLFLEHEFFVTFFLFETNEVLFNNIEGKFFPIGTDSALNDKIFEIRASLSKSLNILIVKRFIVNIFLPEELKLKFFDNILTITNRKEKKEINCAIKDYQYHRIYPFLVEFEAIESFNFMTEFDRTIKEFYSSLSPFIDKTGNIYSYEKSFCVLKLYSSERFDESKVANIISRSLLEYIFSLYTSIIDEVSNYRRIIEYFSNILKKIPAKILIELQKQFIELKMNVFGTYSLLFIESLDRYILYNEDVENQDLTNELFWNKDSDLLTFRRHLKLLNEKIANIQSEIKTILLNKLDRITSFTKEELEKKLKSIKYEKIFRRDILIPILKDLGYENVQDIHGQHEYGVDILFSNQNKFNLIEWNGIIAKIGDLNLDIGTELNQKIKKTLKHIYQAKCMDHLEKNYGNVKITRVFIATNGKINFHAKEVLSKVDPLIEANIFFIDYDLIMGLF